MFASTSSTFDLDAELKRFFGFDRLRPFQRDAINAVLRGDDVLVRAATGSGVRLHIIVE